MTLINVMRGKNALKPQAARFTTLTRLKTKNKSVLRHALKGGQYTRVEVTTGYNLQLTLSPHRLQRLLEGAVDDVAVHRIHIRLRGG